MTHRLGLAMLTLATAISLAACSGATGEAAKSAPALSASTTSAPASASASGTTPPQASASLAPTEESSGDSGTGQGRTVAVDGVRFDLPEYYATLDPAKLADPGAASNPDIKAFADRLGVTAKKLIELFSQADLYAVSEQGAHQGFIDNVNVLNLGPSLPNDSQVRLEFAQIGGHVVSIRHSQTGIGNVVDVSYTLSLQSGVPVHARGILVQTSGQVVDITISSVTTDEAQQVGDQVLASLDQPAT